MCVRWLATVRSPRNSAAATSRFVWPSATRAATRRSAAVRPSSRVRPPMRPSSLRAFSAQVAAPSYSKLSSAALMARAPARFCRCAPADDPEREQRPSRGRGGHPTPRAAQPPGRGTTRPARGVPRGGDKTPAPHRVRKHPVAAHPLCIRLPDLDKLGRRRRRVRAPAGPRHSQPSTSGGSARAIRAPRLLLGLSNHVRPRPDRRSSARRAREPPCAAEDEARTAPPRGRELVPSALARPRARRGGRR